METNLRSKNHDFRFFFSPIIISALAIVLAVCLSLSFNHIIHFGSLSLKTFGVIFDIALGSVLWIWVCFFVGIVFVLFLFLLRILFLKIKEIMPAAYYILGTFLLLTFSMFLLYKIAAFLFWGDCSYNQFMYRIQLLLFGRIAPIFDEKSSSLGSQNGCFVTEIYSLSSLDRYPIKISQAYVHLSNVFILWGINSSLARFMGAISPFISFFADVLGLYAFFESRRKKSN